MLVTFVLLYLAVTVGVGLWAARRVHDSKDYLLAGRSLPLYMSVTVVFATWFGAETVLAVSSTFLKEGLRGVVADPFGFSICLILVGLFFARAFYRMNLLTIGDYYKQRFNRPVELVSSLAITLSYLGWTSAQMTALGVVFHTLSGGDISLANGIMLGAGVVVIYTIFGGMWSVAFTDLIQTVVILLGLIYLATLLGGMAGGPAAVIAHAAQAEKFVFLPELELKDMLWFLAALMTAALGSIPQQDVFQRVTAAKNEQTAVRATIIGGLLYFCIAFVPIYLAYSAFLIDPDMVGSLLAAEGNKHQLILPNLILNHTPLLAQVMFFGALLSAILSTTSGALLAPTAIFTENVLKPFFPHMSDRQFLLTLRLVLIIFALCVLLFALNSEATIYEMVQNAYKVTLVGCFVPLVFGLYWKRANVAGAMLAVLLGLFGWGLMEMVAPEGLWPPQLVGLALSMVGMVAGSLGTRAPAAPHPAHAQHRHPPR
jgi:solute:Na+ symporter, SSS family